MDNEQLNELYDKLLALSDAGDEAAAKKLVEDAFSKLTEEQQGQLVTRMYLGAMDREVEEVTLVADVQQAGLAALDDLEDAKKRLEAGEKQGETPAGA